MAGPSGPAFLYNFYPRSPCGERRAHYDNYNLHCVISIHALLAESDRGVILSLNAQKRFLSTLSLRRATLPFGRLSMLTSLFLSTLSLRRATAPNRHPFRRSRNFYPRSPCGERLSSCLGKIMSVSFLSTLSLRRATPTQKAKAKANEFLSTLSLRRATLNLPSSPIDKNISIHALLAESDHPKMSDHPHKTDFYPRSPCGERLRKVPILGIK